MPERIPCPEPGVYRDVPAATYHAWDAASNSALGKLAGRSPAHAREALLNPEPPTPAKVRGDALHLAVLQPWLLEERYAVAGTCEEELKSGERKGSPCGATGKSYVGGSWYCDKHRRGPSEESRILLAASDFEDCEGMRDAIMAHPDAAALLAATTDREVSLVFDWPGTTIRCKARVDVPAFGHRALGDVKTTEDASAAAFARSAAAYGYYRQDPFYSTGAEVLGYPVDDFYFIAVEPKPPRGVVVYELHDDDVAIGRAELGDLLGLWQRCRESGSWPGYPRGVQQLTLPSWKRIGPSVVHTFDDEDF